ncbi:MAG: succinate dehydrogenase, hydrophobic membrane anchor protein [Hyphomonadaceae bacterium]
MSGFRTARSRIAGRGSAREGAGHFIAQRATAVALFFLAPWLAISAALSIDSYDDAITFLRMPWNAIGAALLMIAAGAHMRIGMQVVIEDYIHKTGTRTALLLLNSFFAIALVAVGLFAILQINFGW